MTTDTTTAPATAPVEVVTPIKPSEAIRLGCLIAPVQAFGSVGDMERTACANGALALGHGPYRFWSDDDYPPCPADECAGERHSIATLTHLNDDHRWSRERIADWLEGLGL